MAGASVVIHALTFGSAILTVVMVATTVTKVRGSSSPATGGSPNGPSVRKMGAHKIILVLDLIGFTIAGVFMAVVTPAIAARVAEWDVEMSDLSAFVLGSPRCIGAYFFGLVAGLLIVSRSTQSRAGALVTGVLVGGIGLVVASVVAVAIVLPCSTGITALTMSHSIPKQVTTVSGPAENKTGLN